MIAKVALVAKVAREFAVIVAVFPKVSPAAVLSVPSEVALIVEVPLNVVVPALIVNNPAAPPLFGLIAMFPVLAPPIVSVFIFNDWMDPFPLSANPFVPPLDGVAAMDATGVANPALPVNANFALVVADPPRRKSYVLFTGERAFVFNWK